MKLKTTKIFQGVIGIIIVTVVIYFISMSPIKDTITIDNIISFVDSFGAFGPFLFMVIYIVGLLLFVPASLFTITGGFLFGALWGTFYIVFAATIAAGLGFLISRKFSYKWTFASSNEFTKKIVSKCEGQCEENGLQTFIILRLLFVPYMAMSYAAGIVKTAKLRDFALATFLTNIAGSFSFAYFGSQLMAGWKALILPILLIVLTLLIPFIVRRLQKAMKRTEL